ncbi:MAG TPA: molybdate ABC transporter permease subunit [Candidatus Polarisedimenticolia bacterium]|nr:molybdate ABC transporter permease subunit [Candidatus Polarisedimenticolia bacterium]
MSGVWAPLWLSLKVAFFTTLFVLPAGTAAGLVLARRSFPGKSVVETLLALPLVLPPTAVGYLLLRLLARDGPLGEKTLGFDLDLLLTWKGAVLAAAIMSLPLTARTARAAFEQVDGRLEQMARTLGLGRARTLFEVTLPLARRGLLAAGILGFSRALGEFGATVIVAGNIPGRTRTLALAIFDDLQIGRDREALALVGVTVALAFAAIFAVETLTRPSRRRRP